MNLGRNKTIARKRRRPASIAAAGYERNARRVTNERARMVALGLFMSSRTSSRSSSARKQVFIILINRRKSVKNFRVGMPVEALSMKAHGGGWGKRHGRPWKSFTPEGGGDVWGGYASYETCIDDLRLRSSTTKLTCRHGAQRNSSQAWHPVRCHTVMR
jgi:hypothetical protein